MKPLSEEQIGGGEVNVIAHGEVFSRAVTFELHEGEKRHEHFSFELHDRASCEMNIFVRGAGELFIDRTTHVLGNDATLTFRLYGDVQENANVCLSDDVRVEGEGAKIDLCTKMVLNHSAHSAARQRVTLLPSAKGAEARQRIDHLILGGRAKAEGIPELDVRLDDVTCSHAATISRPDPDAMFYLLSRGLSHEEAEKSLVHGFLI